MTAPDIVKDLVDRFEQHRDAYRSGRYNETQLRREFLDPFFEALGWDIFNRHNYPAGQMRQDRIAFLVERMLELHKRAPSASGTSPKFQNAEFRGARTPQEQEMVKREIESTDRQIDALVYELYGLTEEEIKIVEGR